MQRREVLLGLLGGLAFPVELLRPKGRSMIAVPEFWRPSVRMIYDTGLTPGEYYLNMRVKRDDGYWEDIQKLVRVCNGGAMTIDLWDGDTFMNNIWLEWAEFQKPKLSEFRHYGIFAS